MSVDIFTFSKQAFNESLDFCNLHNLMEDIKMIDNCQAPLTMQYVLNVEFIRKTYKQASVGIS